MSLESASEAEIAQLDQLLSQLANLKTAEAIKTDTATEVGVAKEGKDEAKWGSSVAGVSVVV